MRKKYKAVGRIIKYDEIDDLHDEIGSYPLCANNMQGEQAIEFITNLHKLGADVRLDFQEDEGRADVVLIYNLSKLPLDIMMEVIEMLGEADADEFTLYSKDTFRLWWD